MSHAYTSSSCASFNTYKYEDDPLLIYINLQQPFHFDNKIVNSLPWMHFGAIWSGVITPRSTVMLVEIMRLSHLIALDDPMWRWSHVTPTPKITIQPDDVKPIIKGRFPRSPQDADVGLKFGTKMPLNLVEKIISKNTNIWKKNF